MTESEWLAYTDPRAMLEFLQSDASERKLRLFACGCCRSVWRWIKRRELRRAVIASESFADGLLGPQKMDVVGNRAREVVSDLTSDAQFRLSKKAYAFRDAARVVGIAASTDLGSEAAIQAATVARGVFAWTAFSSNDLCCLVREIIGNPFHPVSLSADYRTSTVVSLARAAYDERHLPSGELEPHRLSVLADALEEGGAPGELVAHLRSLGPHVRGCFAVDLCLGLS